MDLLRIPFCCKSVFYSKTVITFAYELGFRQTLYRFVSTEKVRLGSEQKLDCSKSIKSQALRKKMSQGRQQRHNLNGKREPIGQCTVKIAA